MIKAIILPVFPANARTSAKFRTPARYTNTGETDISGFLLMQVEYYNGTDWVLDLVVINDTSPRVINRSCELGLDTLFNGLMSVGDLGFGDGMYRVYAAFCDADGEVLMAGESKLEDWWCFEVDLI